MYTDDLISQSLLLLGFYIGLGYRQVGQSGCKLLCSVMNVPSVTGICEISHLRAHTLVMGPKVVCLNNYLNF